MTLTIDKIRKTVTLKKEQWLLSPRPIPLSENDKCLITIYTDSIMDALEKEDKNNG